ncbi:hypothetical protein GIB67_039354 [Kingdonia uniflora]|uniref:Uncharacterized protein n=1 Tax=Kingdonia uniflora TaxID=39325 RepID=A0A7J7LXE7_9MAGN|nr:hypothetical protein GIB67_039354 [Kingdonia uniflora]
MESRRTSIPSRVRHRCCETRCNNDQFLIENTRLTANGRFLSKYLRSECINYTFTYESPLPVGRLVVQLADNAQVCTQRSWKRPYGVGLLVAGLDESGTHLYYNCPSRNYFEYQAFTIDGPFHVIDQNTITELVESFEIQEETDEATAPAGDMQEDQGQQTVPMDI